MADIEKIIKRLMDSVIVSFSLMNRYHVTSQESVCGTKMILVKMLGVKTPVGLQPHPGRWPWPLHCCPSPT